MCSGIGGNPDQQVEESGRVSSNTLVSKMSVSKQGDTSWHDDDVDDEVVGDDVFVCSGGGDDVGDDDDVFVHGDAVLDIMGMLKLTRYCMY